MNQTTVCERARMAAVELMPYLERMNSLESFIERAAELFGNPIVFTDASFRVLAISNVKENEDYFWRQLFKTRTLSDSSIASLKDASANRFYYGREAATYKLRTFSNEVEPGYYFDYKYNYMSIGVFVDNIAVASIASMEYFREYNEDDKDVMNVIAKILSIYAQRLGLNVVSESSMEVSLINILNGAMPRDRILPHLKKNSLNIGGRLAVLVLGEMNKTDNFYSYKYTARRMNAVNESSVSFVYEKHIVTLLFVDEFRAYNNLKRQEIRDFANHNNLRSGCSHVFSDIRLLREHYEQALFAYKHGQITGKPETDYIDCMAEHVLSAVINRPDKMAECAILPQIALLKEHDTQNNSELTYTLREYLKCDGHLKDSAEKLCIHYNTLKYRLSCIQSITGLDVNDNRMRLKIILSFLLQDEMEKVYK